MQAPHQYMEASGQSHTPVALAPGKDLSVGSQKKSRQFEREGNLFSFPAVQPQLLRHLDRSLVTILTILVYNCKVSQCKICRHASNDNHTPSPCKIWGSQSDDDEDSSHLECLCYWVSSYWHFKRSCHLHLHGKLVDQFTVWSPLNIKVTQALRTSETAHCWTWRW